MKQQTTTRAQPPQLIEGEDFYWEGSLMVLTAKFLTKRGYCCANGCRHCPYKAEKPEAGSQKPALKQSPSV